MDNKLIELNDILHLVDRMIEYHSKKLHCLSRKQ